jgi:hypothetical protein
MLATILHRILCLLSSAVKNTEIAVEYRLQAGRSLVRDPMRGVFFFFFFSNYVILPAALGPGWEFNQPLTEVSIRNRKIVFLGVELGRSVRPKTTVPRSVSRLSRQCGIHNISQPYRTSRPRTGMFLLYGDGMCFLWGTNWAVSTATSSQYLAVNCEPIV